MIKKAIRLWKNLRLKNVMNKAEAGTAQTNACHKGVVCLNNEMTKIAVAKNQTNEIDKQTMLTLLTKESSSRLSLT